MKISPARVGAFNVLLRIETERAFSSILLPLYEKNLSSSDRSLCHELTLGTLRRQIYLDRLIDFCSSEKKLDAAVRVALRLGVYQLLFLDKIPEYSAVSESVNLVQLSKKTSAKGFVNAVLRRIAKEKPEPVSSDEIDRISVETSHPRWLVEKWIGDFGFEETVRLAAANNQISSHAFRLIDKDFQFDARRSEFVDGCYLTARIGNDLILAAERGEIYFQDEGSQMTAASVQVSKNGSVLDVCAAPGGKTGMIALRNKADLKLCVAGDLHWKRVVNLSDNCRKQGVEEVKVVQYNAENPLPFADESFVSVLVDAPCSGTGTIRHNPEIRYSLTPTDIAELPLKQLRIIANASKMVMRGGSLIYSTCSLETEENESIGEKFLNENTDFRIVEPNVPERFITDKGFARTFPDRDNMDGFFIAEFRRF
ncbi:MAG: 16S rRNA (cytosine(967)-C(5))-methyltransferase RsmB [Pyrinomonadaceae bacterium]